MIALSVLVLSAGVGSLGLTVAIACRVLPTLALTHTVTVIMVRLPAPSGVDRVHDVARTCFWHCQPVPLPPWTIRMPNPVPRVTTMERALVLEEDLQVGATNRRGRPGGRVGDANLRRGRRQAEVGAGEARASAASAAAAPRNGGR